MKAQAILAVISSLALVISLATLWQSHLAKFKTVAVAGPLQLRISQIKSSDTSWYIPQVDCRVTISNTGARVGKVLGIRMVARYPLLPIPGAHEIFSAHSEVDSVLYRKHGADRFTWIDKASLGDAAPFVLLPRSSTSKHVVFDTRWDDPVIQDEIEFTLEILTDRVAKWIAVEKWTHSIRGIEWSELTEVGTAFTVHPASAGSRRPFTTVPSDLHEYTRGKKEIPAGGFTRHDSRLVTSARSAKANGKQQKEAPGATNDQREQ
ncbi:hypothetical protein [Streptomyces sp. CT34]|uniref:hypothetical protein n=1 Tax=Streptomyces sp. CT34 TaxID=1553907 RepID=UPI0012FF57AB|nr:hypothetical protein [Streptomyces sp. CT34]